jgi:GT2 family glycosyltransferase
LEPDISVVVITYNRRPELTRTLTRLTALPERPAVYVVDNGSRDGTAAMVRDHFPSVTVLTAGRNLGAAARNLGVAAAPTPYVAFCDDDTWWAPGALSRAVAALEAYPEIAVLTGRIVVEPSGAEDPICIDMRTSPLRTAGKPLPGPRLISFLAGASVIRRRAFLAAGGFEPRLLIGGEEELLAAELLTDGWAIIYLPDVEVHHYPSTARDPHLRRRQGIRNTLWFTWLRRPWTSAVARSATIVRSLPRDRVSAAAILDACRGAPWVLRQRRVIPRDVEAMYRSVEEVQFHSGARRYVS